MLLLTDYHHLCITIHAWLILWRSSFGLPNCLQKCTFTKVLNRSPDLEQKLKLSAFSVDAIWHHMTQWTSVVRALPLQGPRGLMWPTRFATPNMTCTNSQQLCSKFLVWDSDDKILHYRWETGHIVLYETRLSQTHCHPCCRGHDWYCSTEWLQCYGAKAVNTI